MFTEWSMKMESRHHVCLTMCTMCALYLSETNDWKKWEDVLHSLQMGHIDGVPKPSRLWLMLAMPSMIESQSNV